jgi:hypothetical protein
MGIVVDVITMGIDKRVDPGIGQGNEGILPE